MKCIDSRISSYTQRYKKSNPLEGTWSIIGRQITQLYGHILVDLESVYRIKHLQFCAM